MFQQQLESMEQKNEAQMDSEIQIDTLAVGVATGTVGTMTLGYALWGGL